MATALEPGMTTKELDDIGRKVLDDHGARSAPEVTYQFPGATCISVNEEVAHGIPGNRVIKAGDLVNIDVSAEKDGIFADTGASYIVPPGSVRRLEKLCSDGKKAMWAGIRSVRSGGRIADIGDAIGKFAGTNGYTLIRNLASHGIGYGLHDEPGEIPTWPDRSERRRIEDGLVFTVEPFLSMGGQMAEEKSMDDPWTLSGVSSYAAAQLQPWGLAALLREPLLDAVLPLDNLGKSKRISQLATECADAPFGSARVAPIADWLVGLRRDVHQERLERIRSAVALVDAARGQIDVADLTGSMAIGYDALYRLFKAMTGLSPKQYIGIIRHYHFTGELLKGEFGSLALLANMQGYYDQAHASKEFKRFTGIGQAEFKRRLNGIARLMHKGR
eukprot:jgi/Tetstr1/450739/TSEL_037775.t1